MAKVVVVLLALAHFFSCFYANPVLIAKGGECDNFDRVCLTGTTCTSEGICVDTAELQTSAVISVDENTASAPIEVTTESNCPNVNALLDLMEHINGRINVLEEKLLISDPSAPTTAYTEMTEKSVPVPMSISRIKNVINTRLDTLAARFGVIRGTLSTTTSTKEGSNQTPIVNDGSTDTTTLSSLTTIASVASPIESQSSATTAGTDASTDGNMPSSQATTIGATGTPLDSSQSPTTQIIIQSSLSGIETGTETASIGDTKSPTEDSTGQQSASPLPPTDANTIEVTTQGIAVSSIGDTKSPTEESTGQQSASPLPPTDVNTIEVTTQGTTVQEISAATTTTTTTGNSQNNPTVLPVFNEDKIIEKVKKLLEEQLKEFETKIIHYLEERLDRIQSTLEQIEAAL